MALSVMPQIRRALLILAFALLGGCASLGAPPAGQPSRESLTAFLLEGRFSLRQEGKNHSGRLSWRHAGVDNVVLLSSPFGQGLAEISTDHSGARLTTSDGKTYVAPDSETLTREVLGYPLPLARLTDWVRGLAPDGAQAERDPLGRLLRLVDHAWTIDYAYDSGDALAPPGSLFAVSADGLELRLRIDEWSSLLPRETPP